jgi:hypothetical protein
MALGGCWLVEVDLKKFFDTLDHTHLRGFLRQRLRDGVLLRLIDKWLRAGVLEDGVLTHPEAGSPQGGVISPLLSNVYLHYVLDVWFEREVKPRLRGRAFLVRYADDFVMGFACEEDARRVLEVLPKRFGKHGLTIHPDKTRLVPFRRPADRGLATPVGPAPKDTEEQVRESFDFLGFTHFWSRSKRGFWVIKRKTAGSGQPVPKGSQDDRPVVPASPTPADSATTRDALSETPRPLRVLRRRDRQSAESEAVPIRGGASLASLADPTSPSRPPGLGRLQRHAQTLCAAVASGEGVTIRSESVS